MECEEHTGRRISMSRVDICFTGPVNMIVKRRFDDFVQELSTLLFSVHSSV